MALDFDGINDSVDLPTGTLAAGRDEVTFCLWLKLNSQVATDTIYDGFFNPVWWEYSIVVSTWYTRTTVTGDTGARDDDVSLPALTNGEWNHLAFVYSVAEGRKTIYLNGVFSAESTNTIDTLNTTRSGKGFGFPIDGTFLDGVIDDARFYNRVLSVAEIQTIIAARGVDGITDSLLARWLMHEGATGNIASVAGSVKDLSDQRVNGDPTNGPLYAPGELRFRRRVG